MNKYKTAVLLVAAILAVNVIACVDPPTPTATPTPTPTAQPLNEAITGAAEEVLEDGAEGQNIICKTCLLANGGDCSQCTGVCVCDE